MKKENVKKTAKKRKGGKALKTKQKIFTFLTADASRKEIDVFLKMLNED